MKKFFLVLLLSLPTWGAAAFNNTNSPGHVSGNSVSAAMSVTAGGSNLAAFACIVYDHLASESITAITYGGNAMTSAGSAAVDAGGIYFAQLFHLANPPTGSNTLAVTGNANVQEIYYNLISFTGVNQATPVRPGTYGTANGNSSPAQLVVSSNANDLTISCLNTSQNILSTNQTSDGINTSGSFGDIASDHATTAAASITHTWTLGAGGAWALAGFSIQAASGAAPPHGLPTLGAGHSFDAMLIWNTSGNSTANSVPLHNPIAFWPSMYVYVRPFDGTQQQGFMVTAQATAPGFATGIYPVDFQWLPSMASSPDWTGASMMFPSGTVLSAVTVQSGTDFVTLKPN